MSRQISWHNDKVARNTNIISEGDKDNDPDGQGDPPHPAPQTTPAFGGYFPGSREYRRISVALFLAGLATFALLYNTQPLLPTISKVFSITAGESALSVSAATLGLGVALLVFGPASEVLGRTKLMYFSLFTASVVGILTGLAPTWELLLVSRVLLGVTLAGLPAVAMSYLTEEIAATHLPRAAGLYIGGTALGGMSGRLVTGLVADFLDWRAALVVVGVISLACAIAVLLLLPKSRNFVREDASLKLLARQVVGAWTDPVLVGLYAVAALGMGAFVGMFNAIGFRLEGPPYNLSVGLAGLVFLVYPVGSVASTVAGRMASRFGQRRVSPVGALIFLIGITVTLVDSLPGMIVGLALMMAGFFAVHGVAAGWVSVRAAAGHRSKGHASSTYMAAYYAGSSAFGPLTGVAWQHGGWDWVIILCAILAGATLALVVALGLTRSLLWPGGAPGLLDWGKPKNTN
ncbi:MAG: MFS transporter [Actinomycetaceae bacterium]|nr:MFS transporter [Actinomycetaceae bacterium]